MLLKLSKTLQGITSPAGAPLQMLKLLPQEPNPNQYLYGHSQSSSVCQHDVVEEIISGHICATRPPWVE